MNLDQLKNEATPYFMPVASLKLSLILTEDGYDLGVEILQVV